MRQRLVIIGAGGFGREVLDLVEAINCHSPSAVAAQFEVLGFLDDGQPDPRLLEPYGTKHLGPISQLDDMPDDVGYVIGIGLPKARRQIDKHFESRPCPVLIHPSATMGREVQLGPGSVVCSHASITNHVRLGRHVHVNLNCTIGHDATLEDYVTLSPLVAISGYVTAEEGSFFGAGATVNPGLTVFEGAVVGAGAAVVKDARATTTVVGVPAKPR